MTRRSSDPPLAASLRDAKRQKQGPGTGLSARRWYVAETAAMGLAGAPPGGPVVGPVPPLASATPSGAARLPEGADLAGVSVDASADDAPRVDAAPAVEGVRGEDMPGEDAPDADAKAPARRARTPDRGAAARRRLARKRVAFLLLVLIGSTAGAHLLGAAAPGRAFAVATGSMEPIISPGDMVFSSPGEPRPGDIIVYDSVVGVYQVHRVVRAVDTEDGRHYVTRGDANEGEDSFLVPEEDVIGVMEGRIPYLGHLWLLSWAWKLALFALLLGSYLGITYWDARDRGQRPPDGGPGGRGHVPVLMLVVLLLPTALGGVSSGYPASDQQQGVLPSPLPLGPGDVGLASVDADQNGATGTVLPPLLWKEIPLHGAADDLEVTGTSYSATTEDRVVIDASHYDPAPTFFLEAYVQAEAGQSVSVVLHETSSSMVARSEITSDASSLTLVRSGSFTLSGAHEYSFHAKVSGGTGIIRQVKVLSMQETPVAETATHVRMSGHDTTRSITTSLVDTTAYWRYDGAATSGTVTAYVEIVAEQAYRGSKLVNGRVQLRDISTGSTAATIVLDDGAAKRYSTSVDLVDGRVYAMRFRSPDATLGGTTTLHHARVVIVQEAFDKTVNYVDLSGHVQESSGTYSDIGYPGRRHGDTEEGPAGTHYFEATLRTGDSYSGRSFVRLLAGGTEVSGSGLEQSDSSRSRERSPALDLLGNTSYRAQAYASSGATATVFGAWIITHLDLSLGDGLRWDHVLQGTVDTPVDTCMWDFSLSGVAATSLTRLGRAEVDWRVGAAGTEQKTPLPSARQFTSAVWTGTHAYVFGGTDGTRTDQIVRYDPATDTTTTMAATLPSARAETSAVWTGTHAYVFGGNAGSGGTHLDDIVRYDPASDTVATMTEVLPSGRRHTSAAWDGTHAYVFGGVTASGNTDAIIRYTPGTGTVTTLPATLPTPRYGTSAVWDGTHAYVFGGADGDLFDDIVRYDPATGRAKLLHATLPTARYYTSAVWADTYAYVIGGHDPDHRDGIDRFDPRTGRVITMEDTLPTGRYGTSAVWDGDAAYVLGGLESGLVHSDDIVRFNAPVQVLGVGGIALPDGRSSASVAWDGNDAYLIGGFDSSGARADEIIHFNTTHRQVDVMVARLPSAREAASAAWDGSHVYVFGGRASGGLLDQIVRFDPATDTVSTMTATLPTAREGTAAVWDGTYVYVLGGEDANGMLDDVLRYDPATDTVTTMAGELPTGRKNHVAFWDGTHAYVAGGLAPSRLDAIVRYDPVADSAVTMAATLPTARHGMAVAWDGAHAYLYGGFDGGRLDQVVRYDPAADAVTVLAQVLPAAQNLGGAFWDGDEAFVLGGLDGSIQRLDTIVRHDPAAASVDDVAHVLRESGEAQRVAPGGTLQAVLDTKPDAPGTSDLAATIDGACAGFGIRTKQSVTYRFE